MLFVYRDVHATTQIKAKLSLVCTNLRGNAIVKIHQYTCIRKKSTQYRTT